MGAFFEGWFRGGEVLGASLCGLGGLLREGPTTIGARVVLYRVRPFTIYGMFVMDLSLFVRFFSRLPYTNFFSTNATCRVLGSFLGEYVSGGFG